MRRCRPLLGTLVEIALRDALPEPVLAAAIERAFDAVARVDRLMSFHDAASDLSRLNAAQAGDVLLVDAWTHEVLGLAQELHTATAGLFDPNVGALLVDWGLLPVHDAAQVRRARGSSLADVELLDACRVRLHAPVCIDLGGIAKGFAVDQGVEALVAAGIRQADINAGGDLRVLGDARPVHVRRPDAPGALVHLGELADGALATSANYFVGTRQQDGPWHGALIAPSTRTAVDDRRSFSVLAPRCAVADALTKVLAVAGELPPACLARYDARSVVL